jgi:hypothetical protein
VTRAHAVVNRDTRQRINTTLAAADSQELFGLSWPVVVLAASTMKYRCVRTTLRRSRRVAQHRRFENFENYSTYGRHGWYYRFASRYPSDVGNPMLTSATP